MPKKKKAASKKKKTGTKKKKAKRKAAKKSSKKKAKKKTKAKKTKPKKAEKPRARKPKAKQKAKPPVTPAAAPSVPPPVPEVATVALIDGDAAPDFSAATDEGHFVSLSDFRGKKLVLYFYPKDDTPGCTREACAFRDGISQIQARGAVVLGVSADSVESHRQFRDKYNLNFPLLSDEDKKIVQAYGVWKEKNMYGRTFMGIERTTFVIDEEGKIRKIFPKVNVEEHYEEVLQALG